MNNNNLKILRRIKYNNLYNENCLITMQRIKNKYIDLILTDPPYGLNIEYENYNDTEKNWYKLINKALPEMKRIRVK